MRLVGAPIIWTAMRLVGGSYNLDCNEAGGGGAPIIWTAMRLVGGSYNLDCNEAGGGGLL